MKLRPGHVALAGLLGLTSAVVVSACSSSATSDGLDGSGTGANGGTGGKTSHGAGGSTAAGAGGTGIGFGGSAHGGGLAIDGGGGSGIVGDPTTCDEAAKAHTYIGCDYWPTVTANSVWSIFDFAVVVANAGTSPAIVTVTRLGSQVATATVAPNSLEKIYLPWVTELKGQDGDSCGDAFPAKTTGVVGGAYHLVSTTPVIVYQFNALEYAGKGGPPGKDWSTCPGNQVCPARPADPPNGCYSFTNDASLLLPSTAMTGNYRVTAQKAGGGLGPFMAITGVMDGTSVDITLSGTADVMGDPASGINDYAGGSTLNFTIHAGDVLQLVGSMAADHSGSIVHANNPVQVITGIPCTEAPQGNPACDHIEESVFPAETLGKHYVVTVPTGPNGNVVGHLVRLYGNVDDTHLVFTGSHPPVPSGTIQGGQVVDLGNITSDFEVTGDHEFAVGSFMLSASLLDPGVKPPNQKGDPSQSMAVAVEQYRVKYVFLAPDDYDISFVDIAQPVSAKVFLDGAAVTAPVTAIGSAGFGVARVQLGPGVGGAHVLTSDLPVGIQVMGYGSYTSYQYPGGLNLGTIAPPPTDIH